MDTPDRAAVPAAARAEVTRETARPFLFFWFIWGIYFTSWWLYLLDFSAARSRLLYGYGGRWEAAPDGLLAFLRFFSEVFVS